MIKGWSEKTVGEILRLEYGKPLEVINRKSDGLYPVYGANGAKDRTDSFYYDKPSIIVGRKGSAGEINLTEPKFWPLDVSYFVTFDEYQYDLRFLYYLLTTLDLPSLAKGVKPGINRNEVYSTRTKAPHLPEQQRIVAILDKAFEGIAKAKAHAKRNLQNARAIFESHLEGVFRQRGVGWVERKLEELGTITSSKRIFKSEYVESGVPFYRTKEIKQLANSRDITTELFISEARYKEIKKGFGVPKEGDILLTAIGTIGEIWVVEGDNDFYFKDGNVLWLKEFTLINPHFLRYVLVSFVESLNKMAHGSAYSALPIQRLNEHRIFLPSPAEQEEIVATLDSLNKETQRLARIYDRKLAALEALKKSVLHQAFSGKL